MRQPAVRFDDLPPISTVLLSHNHYDHCDLPHARHARGTLRSARRDAARNGALVRSSGIRRVEELDWWQEATTLRAADHADAGAALLRAEPVRSKPRAVGRIHAGGRRPRASSSPATPRTRLSSATSGERLGPIDLALLPIGAYEPRWFMQAVHMNPAEAVQAHLDLEASESIGMHFGTFQLTTEGIDEPLRALDEARRENDVRRHGSGRSVSANRCEWGEAAKKAPSKKFSLLWLHFTLR